MEGLQLLCQSQNNPNPALDDYIWMQTAEKNNVHVTDSIQKRATAGPLQDTYHWLSGGPLLCVIRDTSISFLPALSCFNATNTDDGQFGNEVTSGSSLALIVNCKIQRKWHSVFGLWKSTCYRHLGYFRLTTWFISLVHQSLIDSQLCVSHRQICRLLFPYFA